MFTFIKLILFRPNYDSDNVKQMQDHIVFITLQLRYIVRNGTDFEDKISNHVTFSQFAQRLYDARVKEEVSQVLHRPIAAHAL